MIRIDTDTAETAFGVAPVVKWDGDELTDYDQVIFGGDTILISHRLDRVVDIDTDSFAPADYTATATAEVAD